MPEEPRIIFETPVQEAEKLKERIEFAPEKAKEILDEHLSRSEEEIAKDYRLSSEEAIKIAKDIEQKHPEDHRQVEALLQLAAEKGVWNASQIAKKLGPHALDGFHDAYIKTLLFSSFKIR